MIPSFGLRFWTHDDLRLGNGKIDPPKENGSVLKQQAYKRVVACWSLSLFGEVVCFKNGTSGGRFDGLVAFLTAFFGKFSPRTDSGNDPISRAYSSCGLKPPTRNTWIVL